MFHGAISVKEHDNNSGNKINAATTTHDKRQLTGAIRSSQIV